MLSGASETHNAGKDAFQEVDSLPIMSPHAKYAARPPFPELIPKFIRDGYRTAMFGRPGPAFVDLPANLILGEHDVERQKLRPITEAPLSVAPDYKIQRVVEALKNAKAPLVVIGKGVAYARAEQPINDLINK